MSDHRLHRKYSAYLYGPDNLLKPLATIEAELAKSRLDPKMVSAILQLARQYWNELMPQPHDGRSK
ncbi:MAG: hypothetical protein QN120_14705 [Armatimonadota bacterium]|nr:hypothetical protein [Armatimonadota bacterium]